MVAPPQAHANAAVIAERDAKIYRLKTAGLTVRAIAAEVDLSPTRVHEIITEQVAEHIGPAAEAYADHREAELDVLWRHAFTSIVTAKSTADKLKAIETARRINESRRKLRGADAPEAMEITHTANIELSAEVTVRAITTVLERLQLPPDRMAYALEVAEAVLEGGELPAPMSSGLGAAPYVDNGVMYVDGPPGSGIRYRVAATERQPGETAERPALPPAPAADADEGEDADWNRHEIEIFEAEITED